MVKCKTKIAWMLSLVLVVAAVFANVQIAKANPTTCSFEISISIAEGTTAPDSYGVEYQVVDSSGNSVTGAGYGGQITSSDSQTVSLNNIDDSYGVKFTVRSDGLSIKLNEADVTSEGWTDGKTIYVSHIGEEYNFQLFQSQTPANPPAGGGASDSITLDFSDGAVSGNTVTYTVGGASVTLTSSVNIENNKASLGLNDVITVGEGFNPDTMEIVVYAADGFNVLLNVSNNSTSLSQRASEGGYPNDGELKIVVRAKQSGGTDPTPPGPEGSDFSGKAYFVWRGADDKICAHLVEGLDESKNTGTGDESAYKIIYIPVSEVKDDVPNGSGEAYSISNNDYYWMWDTSLEAIGEYASYTAMNEAFERDENLKRTLAIDPTGAVNGASTVCTNGNRDFRATIYADTFEGLDFSVNPNDYTYFPDFWDSVFTSNTVDISGSTAENPAVYESFLLEPTVHFSTASNSANAITGIKALDVPAGAVAVTGDSVSGYDIKFNSNFFDSVVFELKTDTQTYYLNVVRTALQVHDNFGPGMTEPGKVIASLYYDEGQDYKSYEVYATIYNSDGTTTMKKAEAVEIDMDNLGNPMPAGTYTREAGKGLNYSNFAVEVSTDVVGVAFNVVEAGALSGESYGGSYLGSGIGAYYDIEARKVVY